MITFKKYNKVAKSETNLKKALNSENWEKKIRELKFIKLLELQKKKNLEFQFRILIIKN